MSSPDSVVVRASVFHLATVIVAAAALGCGDGSPRRGTDGGQADGNDASAVEVGATPDGATDLQQDQSVPDAGPDVAANQDVLIATDSANDSAVDGPADDTAVAVDTAQVIDGAEATDGASPDLRPVDLVDALPSKAARVTFAFQNTGTETVYLQVQCVLELQVVSEETSTAYPNTSICLCQCSEASCTSEPACGPCAPRHGIPVEPGSFYEYTWAAQTSVVETKTGPNGVFSCVSHAPLAPGAYRVSLSVFSTESAAAADLDATTATTPFELGTADLRIVVPIP